MAKTKLELTWIGKDQRPRLEPRILLEDPDKSYHAPQRVIENDIFDNRLIFGDELSSSGLCAKSMRSSFETLGNQAVAAEGQGMAAAAAAVECPTDRHAAPAAPSDEVVPGGDWVCRTVAGPTRAAPVAAADGGQST